MSQTDAVKCRCCGSRTDLLHFVLSDLRLWASCAACAKFCKHCTALLVGATPVQP